MNSFIDDPTLVLNKSWRATDSISVKKAFTKVISKRALFLDSISWIKHDIASWIRLPVAENEKSIKMSFGAIKVPELILATEYNKIPKRQIVFNRRNIWKRDKGLCQYCGKKPKMDEISIDHVLPKSRGGLSTFSNCVLACTICNRKKGNRTPEEAGVRLINGGILRRPHWSPLYALRRTKCPVSWKAFLHDFDEKLYWEVELEE